MKYAIGFILGLGVTLGLIYGFSSCSAQSEVILKSVPGVEVRGDYANASVVDGSFAILPSPTPTSGEYILYFELDQTIPANTSITMNVYGDSIMKDSHLLLGALYDEESEGFAHRTVRQIYPGDNAYVNHEATDIQSWPFPVTHLCLIRQCPTTASQLVNGKIIPGVSEKENGIACYIDGLGVIIPKKQNIAARVIRMPGIGMVKFQDGKKFIIAR